MTDSMAGVPAPGHAGMDDPPRGEPETNGAAPPPEATRPRRRASYRRHPPGAAAPGAPPGRRRAGGQRCPPAAAARRGGRWRGARRTATRPRRSVPVRGAGAAGPRGAGRSGGTSCACTSSPELTQIAMLEGRSLVEHYVARGSDETTQIDGNIYWGRVQNVLPGMEAAFIDIGIPKNAVLYRGDVRYDRDDIEAGPRPRTPAPHRRRAPARARRSCARSRRTRSAPRGPG